MARSRHPARADGWRVVAIGGGTGLPVLLTGLKREIELLMREEDKGS